MNIITFLLLSIVVIPFKAGWWLGTRAGWKAKKFIDVRIARKEAGYRTPEQYEVMVGDRKYVVNNINEIPERDRALVLRSTNKSMEWNRKFLGDEAPISVRPPNTEKWDDWDSTSDTLRSIPAALPKAEKFYDWDSVKQQALEAAAKKAVEEYHEKRRNEVTVYDVSNKSIEEVQKDIEKVRARAPRIRKRSETTPIAHFAKKKAV